jgi:uncharacterized protein (TIGR02466 family)
MITPKLLDVTPFEPMVIKAHYEFDWEKIKPICEEMIAGTPQRVAVENEHGQSSVYNYNNQPHINPHFKQFYNWLYPIVQHVIKNEWGYEPTFEYSIGNSWVNVHTEGGTTLEHHHGPAIAVVATYLNLPTNSGFIEYRDPLEYVKEMNMHYDLEGWKWKKVKAISGDVLIFPGYLRHRTESSNTNEERWVLTTNIMNLNRPPLEHAKKAQNAKLI